MYLNELIAYAAIINCQSKKLDEKLPFKCSFLLNILFLIGINKLINFYHSRQKNVRHTHAQSVHKGELNQFKA